VSWMIDGNNVLGRLGEGLRFSVDAKRDLVRRLAEFARWRKTRVACYFDGAEPEHFGKELGNVTVVFSGSGTADDLIAARLTGGRGWQLVTSDKALAARVRGRGVEIVEASEFLRLIEDVSREKKAKEQTPEEWLAYFSDPKNRTPF
jgi:predicted RNA-binding protein with PIN domain